MTKEVIILIGINPATETVARHLGVDRQLVLADLLYGATEGGEAASAGEAAADPAPRPAEALAKVLRRAGLKSRSTKVDLNQAESVQNLIAFAERLGEPKAAFLMDGAAGAATPLAAIDLAATARYLQELPALERVPAAVSGTGTAAVTAAATAATAAAAASMAATATMDRSHQAGGAAPAPGTYATAATTASTQGQAASPAAAALAASGALHGTAAAATATGTPAALPTGLTAGQSALIVCFSPTGNTETVAWMIQKYTNAEVADLKPLMLYPRDYKNAMEQVQLENQLDYLPKLGRFDTDISPYSLICVGFPVWDSQLPPPVKTWLKTSALAGKTIVPFTTHAGGGAGTSFEQISECCPDSTVLPGLVLAGNRDNNSSVNAVRGRAAAEAEKQVQQWLGVSA